MKTFEKEPRKFVGVSISMSQYRRVIQQAGKTTCRNLSEYMRKKIVGEPLTLYYRNQSYDEFTEAYVNFKRDLDAILEKGLLGEPEKQWLQEEIVNIKEIIVKLYDHVSKNWSDKELT